MVTAMLIVPFMDAIAKLLSARYPILQLVWARFFFHFLLITPIALWRHGPTSFVTKKPVLQVGRGLYLLAGTACFFVAIKFIPLTDAIALIFFDAVIVIVLAALFLREPIPSSHWVAAVFGLIGVLMIVRPGFETFHPASLLALVASVFFALYLLSTRLLTGKAPPLVTLSYQSVGGFVLMSAVMPFIWVEPTMMDLVLMSAIGLTGAIGHLLLIRAFEFADVSLLAPYLYTEIIMQVVLGYWLFGDIPDIWAGLGIALIIAVGIFLSLTVRHTSDLHYPSIRDKPL
jgi:drug/metabolite transporter (DMT)-like permease